MASAALLSHFRTILGRFLRFKSLRNLDIQVTSQMVKAMALYSASVLLATTCFMDFQEIGEDPSTLAGWMHHKPVVDLLDM